MKPLVVKIGGSLSESGRLIETLAIVARSRRPVVVVPGGGPFADAVREAQTEVGFSDAAAHVMAILAMHQMAHAMVALQPGLMTADTLSGLRRAWCAKRVPIWLPLRLSQKDRNIPADWSITSDGLAARLAERLGGMPLVLIKSCRVAPQADPEDLARAGVVDPVFAVIVRRAGLDWRILGPGEEDEVSRLVNARPVRGALRKGATAKKRHSEASTARR